MNNNTLDLAGLLADNTPDGMEVDMEKSTLQKVVFKEKKVSTRWKDLGDISGYYTSAVSSVHLHTSLPNDSSTNTYATKAQCKAHLAQAQLSQIMKKVNGDWVADWSDRNQTKYGITYYRGEISIDQYCGYHKFLTFKSAELAEQVLRENADLLEQYKPLAG